MRDTLYIPLRPWPTLAVAAMLALLPLAAAALGQPFYVVFATRVLIYALIATSLNLLIGYGGMTGFVVVGLMLQSAPIAGWNAFFLISTILTSVTGYFFPIIKGLTPAHIVGAISLVILAVALFALYSKKLAGRWRAIYVASAVAALWLNFFVAIVQSFNKFAFLNKFAPTGSELPFAATQGIVLILFIIMGVAAVRRYHPVD